MTQVASPPSSSSSNMDMISLKTADGVESLIAKQMQTVQNFIDDAESNSVIPLPNINSRELVKIIEYCKHHNNIVDDKAKDFDVEFVKALSYKELFGLILATNYLNMKELLDFMCQTTADRIKEKSPKFVWNLFNIDNDYTPKEEANTRKENAWAHEGVEP